MENRETVVAVLISRFFLRLPNYEDNYNKNRQMTSLVDPKYFKKRCGNSELAFW